MKINTIGFLALTLITSQIFGSATSIVIAETIISNTYTASTTLSQPNPAAGQPVSVSIALSTNGVGIQNATVQAQIFNSSNKKVYSQNITGQTITSSHPATANVTWTPVTRGAYYVKIGIFSYDWSSNPFWSNNALAFTVATAPVVTPPRSTYGLNEDGQIQETGSMTDSTNSNWWLNSGAYFSVVAGVGKTNQGRLSSTDTWRKVYVSSNPIDTDEGTHPQNIFRLVTKSKFQNMSQEAYFKINGNNLSTSSNRNSSNGLLFFNRYVDANNLYYTGMRVDGTAIIKKKINGVYYTMDQKSVFTGLYSASSNPNLLPLNTYIGVKSVVIDLPNGTVSIKVYVDKNNSGTWTLAAEALDTGSPYGPVIKSSAYAGIRTDFMDVEFKGYKVGNI